MSRLEVLVDYLFSRRRWVIHLFFWLLVLSFYVIFFGRRNNNYFQTFFFVGLLMPVTIATTYLLNYYLVPRYLMKERYVLFLLYFLYALIVSLFIEMMIAMLTFLLIAESNMKAMSPASVDIFFMLAALLVVVFMGMGIKMVLHWRNSREDYQKLMRDKVEVELRFLKSQLHPHFLFNTLNNLYYLALEKSDKTPGAILALSELLDYVLHETKSQFISLEKELKQVENYIALESLRYEDRLTVNVVVDGDMKNKRIVPMMLITLIENSFKHGVTQTIGKTWIRLHLSGEENKVSVHLENSIKNKVQVTANGVGLKNLQSQLDLLYGDRGQLKIENGEESFIVRLELTE
ncbi:MAG TPA: histidine kinase [Cyclobacteriaceae bacterium]